MVSSLKISENIFIWSDKASLVDLNEKLIKNTPALKDFIHYCNHSNLIAIKEIYKSIHPVN